MKPAEDEPTSNLRLDLIKVLERVGDPIPPERWKQFGVGALPDSFVGFMAAWGGSAIYSVWAKAAGATLEEFLGDGKDALSVAFEHDLLDADLRHLAPFATNGYGGRFFISSRDGSVWYWNVHGRQDVAGGRIAETFDEFLAMIDLSVPTDPT